MTSISANGAVRLADLGDGIPNADKLTKKDAALQLVTGKQTFPA
jgi:hypothetical protein